MAEPPSPLVVLLFFPTWYTAHCLILLCPKGKASHVSLQRAMHVSACKQNARASSKAGKGKVGKSACVLHVCKNAGTKACACKMQKGMSAKRGGKRQAKAKCLKGKCAAGKKGTGKVCPKGM